MTGLRTTGKLGLALGAAAAAGVLSVVTRNAVTRTSGAARPATVGDPTVSPMLPPWTAPPAQYGTGVRRNVAVQMSDGVVLRANVHYPTVPGTGQPAAGPFPVLLSITPYGKLAPPPAAQLGGGPSPHLIRRGYIEVMVDVRGTGASGGSFEMFGPDQTRDGVELVTWASTLPNCNGRVGMFGISYLAINQLFTAAAVGPGSPLKAIFPVMASNDFYRDAAAMGGAPHLRTIQAYGSLYRLLNVLNPLLEFATPGSHERPRAGGRAAVRQRGRDQRGYFEPLLGEAREGGDAAFDGPFWDTMRPDLVLPEIAANDVAVFLTGGWHDAFQRGAPLNYAGLQNACTGRSPHAPMQPGQPLADRIKLLMGPWYHVSDYGGLNVLDLQLRWFDYWLKDDAAAAISDSSFTFQAIGDRRWYQARDYPLAEATPTRLYLSHGGRLANDADAAEESTTATLAYRPRGPISGRSLEQWALGVNSFAVSQAGGRTRRDQDNRRVQPGALTYTTEPFEVPTLIAGPITLTVHATADRAETLWVAHLDDVAPGPAGGPSEGVNRPLTMGALLGSHRELDPDRTWYLPDGTVLYPHHLSTRAAVKPVTPGELTRYDIEIFPTAALIAAGHRLRLTLTTYDFPHLVPTAPASRALAGGLYQVHQGGATPSFLVVPLADPDALD